MSLLQVYASELAKFSYKDESRTVLVAGADIKGVAHESDASEIDPMELVGRGVPSAKAVKKGTEWVFRSENPIVVKDNGGKFAFLLPADEVAPF